MYNAILLLHVLAATVWTGGHLVLSFSVLPRAIARRDPEILLSFEAAYERIGMPALIIQTASGLWMAFMILPNVTAWWSFATPAEKLIALKLALLVATAVIAFDTRRRLIPRISADTLPYMARRIRLVTTLSVLFVVAGVSFRGGLLV